MFERAAEIERLIRARDIEGGRGRFIRRSLLEGLLPWAAWSVAIFAFKVFLFSWPEVIWTGSIVFPIWMLGAYLNGRWRWNDLMKNQ